MARTIVIKGADFSTNALDQVVFDGIHAESISLSQSSIAFDAIGDTVQLECTVSPSDAIDPVNWSSTDTDVATVSQNGLVTVVGCGACNIVARAGNVSAACAITVEVELTFDRYTRTSIYASTSSNSITNTDDMTGTSGSNGILFLSACIGESTFNNLILSRHFTAISESTGQYELITTRQGLVDANLTGAVRIFDHIGFPVPIVIPHNCTKIRCIALNEHYGAYPLFYKHDVNAYPKGSGTEGSAHWSPYRAPATPLSQYTFTWEKTVEFDVPDGFDSISVTWKADGETGTVNPVNLPEAQLSEFRIICL